MSWSKSASGTADEIRAQIEKWPEQIANADGGSPHLTREAKQGHAAQIEAAVKTTEQLAGVYPTTLIGINANGHANDNGEGYVNVNYTLLKAGDHPPPAPPAE